MKETDKARAIIADNKGNVIISNYDGCLIFPGGKLNDNKDSYDAVIREVKEESGLEVAGGKRILTIHSAHKNYPEVDGTVAAEKRVNTDYSYFKTDNEICDGALTDHEKLGHFAIYKVLLDDLPNIIKEHKTENERWLFFMDEMTMALMSLAALKRRGEIV